LFSRLLKSKCRELDLSVVNVSVYRDAVTVSGFPQRCFGWSPVDRRPEIAKRTPEGNLRSKSDMRIVSYVNTRATLSLLVKAETLETALDDFGL
jgi:hypothetical protein